MISRRSFLFEIYVVYILPKWYDRGYPLNFNGFFLQSLVPNNVVGDRYEHRISDDRLGAGHESRIRQKLPPAGATVERVLGSRIHPGSRQGQCVWGIVDVHVYTLYPSYVTIPDLTLKSTPIRYTAYNSRVQYSPMV